MRTFRYEIQVTEPLDDTTLLTLMAFKFEDIVRPHKPEWRTRFVEVREGELYDLNGDEVTRRGVKADE